MSLHSLKWSLRRQIKDRLSQVSQSSFDDQSVQVAEMLQSLGQFQKAESIGLYMNLPTLELPTGPLINTSFEAGQRVYLPRVTKLDVFGDKKRFEKQTAILHFLRVNSSEEAASLPERGRYRIREPEFDHNDLFENNDKLDILVLPGLAFSKDCKRLGHGAGFYDDFIKRYCEKYHEKPLLIGVGVKEQLLDHDQGDVLHVEEHDERLDYVILGGDLYARE